MKKYVIIGVSVLLIILVYSLLSLYTGLYINFRFNEDEIKSLVIADSNNIYLNDNQFIVKGVKLNSFYPGNEFSDFNIDKETYLSWIKQISDMGANTIELESRLNPEFYEALYEYNTDLNNSPIYIFQGIAITDYESNNSGSIHEFKNNLKNECRIAVDVIHGNRYLVTSKVYANGLYSKDVSPWTLGYLILNIGKEETIAYTDNTDIRYNGNGFNGKYFYTESGSSETECILAEIFDEIVSYEVAKYGEQKLVSFMVNMVQDIFKYRENVNVQLGKMCYIDLNNVKYKENLKSGKVVSYDLTTQVNDFVNLLNEEQKYKYKDIIKNVNVNTYYDGFVDFIIHYYDSPVLIGSYGFSTARIKDREDSETLTEYEQGKRIAEAYKEFVNLGTCGAVIANWQDNWAIETWNTLYSVDEENEVYWLDSQSLNQKYGILSFTPAEEDCCFVDGNLDEWTENDFVIEENGLKLYSKYDFENLYIMVDNISEDDDIYIPIDTTQNSGSSEWIDGAKLEFDRPVDFIIKLDGSEYGEIFVHDYYDSIRAMYENNITGELQYSHVPDKNTNEFVSERALLKKRIDPEVDISSMTAEERQLYRRHKVYNTGRLLHGNSNPDSSDFNSLADYYFSENSVEIKIPWALLNFYAPNKMLIHDDYYRNYGVEGIKVDKMYIGVGRRNDSVELGEIKLNSWNDKIIVKERLKKSYDIIKKCWNEE